MGFHVIGVGPGDSELMTLKAVRLIKEAKCIIVPVKKKGSLKSTALSIAKPYIEDLSIVQYIYFPMKLDFQKDGAIQALFKENGDMINRMIKEYEDVVFLTLGDPSVYSTFSYIQPYINEVQVVPGITSFLNGAALLKQSLCLGNESLCIMNMTDDEAKLRQNFIIQDSIVIMKVSVNQELLKKLVKEYDRSIIVMSNIGLEEEFITMDINALDEKLPYFTIAIIR